MLEVGLLELMRVEPLEPISGLLAKLQALEARLEGRAGSRQLTVESGGPSPNRELSPKAKANPNQQQHEHQGGSYNRLIEAVLEIEPRLSGLALSRLVARDQRRLSIAFDKEFDAEQVRARLPQLRAALKQATGADLEIEIAVAASGGGGAETLVEAEQRKVAEERQRRVQEALDHPMRKKLEQEFAWRKTDDAMSEGPPDFGAMLEQAQAMQQQMMKAQEEAKKRTVEASAGGGMVTVTVSGALELKALRIDPQAIDPKDLTMLQDLVIAAVNQGLKKAQELQTSAMQSIAGGLHIPGLF